MRAFFMNTLAVILAVALPWCSPNRTAGAEGVRIVALEPTPLFPKVKPGEPLGQIARLKLENGSPAVDACVKITAAGQQPYLQPLGRITPKESVQAIRIPDFAQPVEIGVELYLKDNPRPVDTRKFLCRPQKKWRLYCVAYSHHDLGFGDYPHRLRHHNPPREHHSAVAILPRHRRLGRGEQVPFRRRNERADHQLP